ncbi:MAG: S26 family signal peptidase [Thermoplasmatales archaeon]|nr:S26 family signal peptidase [Thermoplasmatales archaeon]
MMEREKILSFIREIIVAVAFICIILIILWGYTGQFPHSPMVVVTSSSMMHSDASFGKIGTIDPGDLVLVKKAKDIVTREEGREKGYITYRDYGDVIIYYPNGNKNATPIIHRAICWVEKNKDGTYTVEEYGIYNQQSITIPELELRNYKPPHSGFITKGDNNGNLSDQATELSLPVKPEWVLGKARGEIPWFGLIKLIIFGNENGYNGNDAVWIGKAVAPRDEWICLGISLFVIIGIPSIWDGYNYYKKWKLKKLRL